MKNDTVVWLAYAKENLAAARILLDQELYNPCLQNVQQSVEKFLKAVLLEKVHTQRKTHSILELLFILQEHEISISLTHENCDLLDSIYLPSKYPLGGALPDFHPDKPLCEQCITMAEKVAENMLEVIGSK